MKYGVKELEKENIFSINKEVLKEDDYTYIQDHDDFWEQVKRFEDALKNEGRYDGMEKGIIQTTINGIKVGFSNEIILKMTNLTDEIINNLRKQIKMNCRLFQK
ncbi:MAG: hypothetical protein HY738_12395 [Bacteroidia bacterium]|nr:hypothetical protein [Bacteroidia bacterium]